jgi:hypothetical protein
VSWRTPRLPLTGRDAPSSRGARSSLVEPECTPALTGS